MLTLDCCFCWCLYTKKVCVVHSQLANECLNMVSYGFLPSILQVWVAEGWQVWRYHIYIIIIYKARGLILAILTNWDLIFHILLSELA